MNKDRLKKMLSTIIEYIDDAENRQLEPDKTLTAVKAHLQGVLEGIELTEPPTPPPWAANYPCNECALTKDGQ